MAGDDKPVIVQENANRAANIGQEIDYNHPLFLSPSDVSRNQTISFQLTGNYESALYSRTNGNQKFTRNSHLYCDVCKIRGHNKDNCWKIVGYPPEFKFKKRKFSEGGSAAYNVSAKENTQNEVLQAGNEQSEFKYGSDTNVFSHGKGSSSMDQIQSKPSQVEANHFRQEQYNHIVQMLAQHNPQVNQNSMSNTAANTAGMTSSMALNVSHKPNWIVDTGATNHMASRLELLNKLSVNKLGYNRTVELPNGDETKVTHTSLSSISDDNACQWSSIPVTTPTQQVQQHIQYEGRESCQQNEEEELRTVINEDTTQIPLQPSRKSGRSNLGELRYFLGIEFARSNQGILMHQRKYTLELISETGLSSSKPAATPMDTNVKLTTKLLDEYIKLRNSEKFNSNDQLADQGAYQRLIGKLLYLTVTRPDIAFGVNTLSQFLQQQKKSHMEAALRIVRYVKNQPGLGVLLSINKNTTLTAYCDSDWASCPHIRRSVTGYLVKFRDSLLTWKSKKQTTISKSSAEAEYRSMAAIVSELIWIIGLMKELGLNQYKKLFNRRGPSPSGASGPL
uniref:Reverse transcriptase Ty1/copia-type domain-containing protein n=1 Tax=Solanum lycopersicum TaxID=4081 RepID=A0A3Q7H6I8_SOLLC